MEVIKYDDKYLEDVRRLTKEFHQESLNEYGMSFDPNALDRTIDDVKASSYLMIIDDKCQGMLAGKEVKTPTSMERYWHEVVWFVNKEYRRYGVRLLNTVKEMLKADGFDSVVMIYMHNSKSEKLHDLYIRMGLKPMETHYIGRLK